MQTTKSASNTMLGELRLFVNIRVLIITALLIAMSIVFGKFLPINIGPLRISFENLPILMAGILFGPAIGAVAGLTADIIGCILVGYAINPIITLGAALIGCVSGLMYRLPLVRNDSARLIVSVFAAHLVGSMIVKSIGLMVYYGYTIQSVALRVPLYIGISMAESAVLFALMRNKAFTRELERIRR